MKPFVPLSSLSFNLPEWYRQLHDQGGGTSLQSKTFDWEGAWIVSGVLTALTVVLFLGAALFRNIRRRRKHGSHRSARRAGAGNNHPDSTPPANRQSSSRRRSRKRRRSQRRLNPTLAETGGLPPASQEEQQPTA